MKVAAIVVGFNHWHYTDRQDGDWTKRFVHELAAKNPELKVLVIDNASQKGLEYKSDTLEIIHCEKRRGYGKALNIGLHHLRPGNYDWYITLNNDCQMARDGDVLRRISELSPNVLYGSGWNVDNDNKINWQFSAWLVISKKILQKVGFFDEELEAAFEDFDYERRAVNAGFGLDTADLPIEHLDMHTRYEDPTYAARWEEARLYFEKKHGIPMKSWYTHPEIERAKNARRIT